MTQEEKKRPINRLQSMYALRALTDKRYEETREAQKEGKPVAWCMAEPWATPFLNVMGMASVYPEEYASVAAAAGVAQSYLDRSAAEGFPTHLCGYLQNTLGYAARMVKDCGGEIPPEAPRGGMPRPALFVCSGSACDARYKGFQSVGRYLDAPVWTTEVLYQGFRAGAIRESLSGEAYEHGVRFLVKELRELATFLERLMGKKINWDDFEEDIDRIIEMNRVWYGITDEMRMARPCPMNARDHFSVMSSSLFRATDPGAVKELYAKMGEEVQERIDKGIAGINREEKYRVAWTGLGPWHSMNIFDNLAERGWNFVREGYHPPRPIDLSWVKDPLEKLVRYRSRDLNWEIDFEFGPEEAAKVREEIRRAGVSTRLVVKDAIDYRLDAIFIHTVTTCRVNAAATRYLQNQFMDLCKIPCMVIQGDMIDARLFDMENTMRQAEAFEETMDYYKDVRKKEGLPW